MKGCQVVIEVFTIRYSCGNIMVVVTALPLSDFPFFSVYTERLVWVSILSEVTMLYCCCDDDDQVFVYCLSSMYMYCWDVGMDWGIVSFSTTDHTGNITIIM